MLINLLTAHHAIAANHLFGQQAEKFKADRRQLKLAAVEKKLRVRPEKRQPGLDRCRWHELERIESKRRPLGHECFRGCDEMNACFCKAQGISGLH